MKSLQSEHIRFISKVNRWLLILLVLMIACFFSWSENVLITRAIKVVGRMSVLIGSYWVYRKIISYGAVDTLRWHNPMVLIVYGIYLLLGFASFMWSTNVGYSSLQWFMTSQTLVFCYFFIRSIYLLDEFFPGHNVKLYNLLGNSSFILILVFVIGMWVKPEVFFRLTHGGEEARLGGYLMNPNELGMLAAIGVSGLIFDIYRNHRKWFTILKIAILFYALISTGSRSSLIGTFLIIGFHIKQSNNIKLKLAVITVMIIAAPYAVHKVVLKDGDSERLEEVLSMTGRLPFWKALILEGLPREPLLGFGFMRIDYNEYFSSTHTYAAKMTHNTFIQVLMNLGFIGLTLIIFQMIFTFSAIARERKEKKLMIYGMLIPLIINSFTEFGIFGESNYGILFYQLLLIYVSYRKSNILSPKNRIYLKKRRPELFNDDQLQVIH